MQTRLAIFTNMNCCVHSIIRNGDSLQTWGQIQVYLNAFSKKYLHKKISDELYLKEAFANSVIS